MSLRRSHGILDAYDTDFFVCQYDQIEIYRSASSCAMLLWVATNSSASTLRVPSMTPAAIRALRFQRNRVAWQIPVSAATEATGSPDRSRATICRRTDDEYIRGM